MKFNRIGINDKKWMDPLLAAADMRGCHHNFTNLFAWANIYDYRAAQFEDYLVVKGVSSDGTPYYMYPAGQGDPKSVIRAMIEDAETCGTDFLFAGLSTENIAEINRLLPNKFEYTERRDNFDYVYLVDKLINLTGADFRAKRNHINYFKKNNTWSFEQISSDNLTECWAMNIEWCKTHRCSYDIELTNENCAVRRCFEHFAELELEGGLIRSEAKVIAYTMGEKLNSDTYDIHIEKAYEDIQGAYQIINHEFVAFIQKKHPELIYVNREEDMGEEGLRKSKLSYHPDKMEEKYWGKFIGSK